MICTAKILFCENEHGCGDVTFPNTDDLNERSFMVPMTIRMLRAKAKIAGWTRSKGRDLCDICSEEND